MATMFSAPSSTKEMLVENEDDFCASSALVEEECRSSEALLAIEEEAFAVLESKAVSYLRMCVLAVLVASAAAVAITVYYYTVNSELDAFEASFSDDATKVIEAVSVSLYISLEAADTYLVSTVSHARSIGQQWPFVTLPDLGVRMSKLRSLSKSVVVQQAHFVTAAEREEWENYTLTHDDWAQEALDIQKTDKNYNGAVYDSYIPDGEIHSYRGRSEGPGPFLPTWQSSPVVPLFSTYNWDALAYSSVSDELDELFGSKRVVISKVSNLAYLDDPVSVAETEAAVEYIKGFIQEGGDPREPFSVISVPIIAEAANSVSLFDDNGEANGNHTVVGMFTMMFFWRDLIQDILPPGSDGTVVVFENGCDQSFTYQINGPEAQYLGRGDLHDSHYDYMGRSLTFTDLVDLSGHGRQYTGLPLGGVACAYKLRVYPSVTLEEVHKTNDPTVFTVVAVLIFVFTSAIFLFYDVYVERRQRKVMNTAVQSTASVSLLERMVKERTCKLEETNARLEEANRRVTRASAAQLEHFACMSHEIRTPLNCIIGLSSLLLDRGLNPMQEESMRMIVSSGDLLLTVVNDVLDYSKLESGNVEIEIQRSNLQETLQAVVHSIETKALPKQLSVRALYDPKIGEFVHMDCRRLQQILYNLLGNAVNFSHPGGIIDLSVTLCPASTTKAVRSNTDPVEEILRSFESETVSDDSSMGKSKSLRLSSLPQSGSEAEPKASKDTATEETVMRFVVKDYGKGIASKDFERIFQPFRQASAETERVYGGTGLGLAITAKLVSSLGGEISVNSEEGKWAQFTFELPTDFRDVPANVEELRRKLKDTTILFIDDDSVNVGDVSRIFRQCHLDFVAYTSMGEMVSLIEEPGFLQPTRSYICLVHERLYEEASYQTLAKAAKSVMLTHGPKYSVKESAGHYRSLAQVLPSVLMESFSSFVDSLSTVPLPSSRSSPVSSPPFTVDKPVENLRILMAEDNKINQKVLMRMLQRLGFEDVDIADDGQQACDKELQKQYDVILMDIQMPNVNGIEACKEILNREGSHPKPQIVFLTAHVSDAYETECRTAGGVGFLPKPFNIRDIENCLQQLPRVRSG